MRQYTPVEIGQKLKALIQAQAGMAQVTGDGLIVTVGGQSVTLPRGHAPGGTRLAQNR